MFTFIYIYVYNSLMLNSKEINMTQTREQKIEAGYQRLFKSAWTTYITKVADANNCSVDKIVKISNALPNVRKELEEGFLKIIAEGSNKVA